MINQRHCPCGVVVTTQPYGTVRCPEHKVWFKEDIRAEVIREAGYAPAGKGWKPCSHCGKDTLKSLRHKSYVVCGGCKTKKRAEYSKGYYRANK